MEATILIGPICSGKTHLLKTTYSKIETVDVGDIVRSLTSTEARVFDQDLDYQIADQLRNKIQQAVVAKKDIVIAGVRQLSILLIVEIFIKKLQLSPENKIKYSRIYLNVDPLTRRNRFELRVTSKDNNLSFDQIEARDNKLGLKQLTNYCLIANPQNTIVKNT